jgi:DNA-binding ferritin-like protein
MDALADRISALGQRPENIFSEYISLSLIPESKKIWEGEEAIANILESYSIIIEIQKRESKKHLLLMIKRS